MQRMDEKKDAKKEKARLRDDRMRWSGALICVSGVRDQRQSQSERLCQRPASVSGSEVSVTESVSVSPSAPKSHQGSSTMSMAMHDSTA
eukprot:2292842-Rhodomonas_salina.2